MSTEAGVPPMCHRTYPVHKDVPRLLLESVYLLEQVGRQQREEKDAVPVSGIQGCREVFTILKSLMFKSQLRDRLS
jgi:hypothetical protein